VVLPVAVISSLVNILALQKGFGGLREAGTHDNYFLV
jgi:hypothetical protein